MFSEKFFEKLRFWHENLAPLKVTRQEVGAILDRIEKSEPIDSRDRWLLFNIKDDWTDEHKRLLELCERSATAHFAFAMSPLYVSNACYENCPYCGDRRTNKEQIRIRLTEEQFRKECSFLAGEQGMNNIELVYATDRQKDPRAISKDVEIALEEIHKHHNTGGVWVNAERMTSEGYRTLKQAGCTGIILWQECYDPSLFRFHHQPDSPKGNQLARLDVYDHVIQENLEIGVAILSGLAPWQFEWWMLCEHIEYLKQTYGFTPTILGTPRLTHADLETDEYNKKLSALFRPNDAQFQRAISVARLSFPEIHPWHQTREPWDLSVELMMTTPGCVTTYLCSTSPGGYTLAEEVGLGPQFKIHSTPFEKAQEDLRAKKIELIRKWQIENHRIHQIE